MTFAARIGTVRMKDGYTLDSLTNALTGMGTGRDIRMANAYVSRSLTQGEIAAAYSGSGLMRKIVSIPALDMVRAWRAWNAESADITKIEDEEKRLRIRQKVRQAEVLRGMGGGAFILGLPGVASTPAPEKIGAGQLLYVHVVHRWHLSFGQLDDQVLSPTYGEPAMWKLSTTRGPVDFHPSRVIPFRADQAPPIIVQSGSDDYYWGESKVAQVLDAVQDCDTARQSFAALIQKARNVRIGIPDLLATVSDVEGEAAFQRRMAAFSTAESIFNATVYDSGRDGQSGEEIKDNVYNFAGLKDVLQTFAMFASAVSDIPQSRLFGTAPEGMNSSGNSQQLDWNKMVAARQTLDLEPCLAPLDYYLKQSAGVTPDTWSEFNPLDQETEAQEAERFGKIMVAVTALQNTGTIADVALTKGVQSLMIDEGFLPGLESALAELPEDERFGVVPDTTDLAPPVDTQPALRLVSNDASPRSIYVSRPVLNRGDLQTWATAQGLGELQDDLHVTIVYSRTQIDWMKIDSEDWAQEKDGTIEIAPGGVRIVEPLGDKSAVLLFTSSRLAWRHQQILSAGATSDYPDYQPHVSLTEAEVDLSKVEPYRGVIRLGPEKFEEAKSEFA